MDAIRKEAMEAKEHSAAVPSSDVLLEFQQLHDELSSKLEQQIRLIAMCFRLKEPQNGFSPSEWLVLNALVNGTEYGLKPLAQQVSISVGTTSKIVRKLVMMRLVEWKHSDTDRRNYALSITARGLRTYRQIHQGALRNTAACFATLTVGQLVQITSLLDLCMPAGKFNY